MVAHLLSPYTTWLSGVSTFLIRASQFVWMPSRDRRLVYETVQSVELKGSFIFIKLASRDFVHLARLGYVSELFGKL